MLRPLQLLVSALLFSICLSAQAQVQTWKFRFEWFDYRITTSDDYYAGTGGGYTIDGTFSGEDRDRDGVLELPELSSLFAGYPMTGCPTGEHIECSVSAFTFSPEAGLHFSATSVWHLPGVITGVMQITTGDQSTFEVPGHLREILIWNPQTRLIVTQVPEPSSYLMMAVGGLLLGALARRRRALR